MYWDVSNELQMWKVMRIPQLHGEQRTIGRVDASIEAGGKLREAVQ